MFLSLDLFIPNYISFVCMLHVSHFLYQYLFDNIMALKLALKVVITSTAVYWTNQLEVWSELSSKERAYDQLISSAKQYITKNTPDSLKLQARKIQDDKVLLVATVNQYYNQGVMKTFDAVSNLPSTIAGLYNKALEQLNTPPAKTA